MRHVGRTSTGAFRLVLLPQGCVCSLLLALSFSSVSLAQDVLTYHNDMARTGLNPAETTLTPANVNSSSFGKLFVLSADGKVDAQPLHMSSVPIPGKGTRNVLVVASEHDSVYAVDAGDGTPFWQVSTLMAGETPSDDRGCGQVTPQIGVTATPVIDRSMGPNGTIYVVAMSKDASGHYHQRLHALDITTGQEEFGGPVEVQATYPGTGDNSSGGNVIFDPGQYKERPGLLLLNGLVYTFWSSHCDFRPYTGWIISYNAGTLVRVSVLNITPNGSEASVWASGAGPAVDASGNIYFLAGNGSFDTTLNAQGFPSQGDYGNAFLKLSTTNNTLAVADYFNMFNTIAESTADLDLGSGGALVLPDMADSHGVTRHLAVGAGKDHNIYLVDRDNMGKFSPRTNNIYQELPSGLGGPEFGMPAYFSNRIYYGAVGDELRAFQFTSAQLQATAVGLSAATFTYPGTTPSISANGTNNGIVWAIENTNPAVLHAYDASDLSRELYNSNQAGTRDHFGAGNKFITPTIANGRVYAATTTGVGVFGLLPVTTASISPSTLTLGSQIVGSSSSPQTVALTNTGAASLTLTAISVTGPFGVAMTGTTCSTSIPVSVGSACTVAVIFAPTAGGPALGNLSFSDNASDSPQIVSLSGTGQDFTFAPPSGSSTSATVSPGQTATYTLAVGGEGGLSQAVTFTCMGEPSEATCTVSPNSVAASGSATNVTVNVTTTAPSVGAPRLRQLPPLWPLPSWPGVLVMAALALAAVALTVRDGRQARVGRLRAVAVALSALLLLALAMGSCGGGTAGVGGGGTSHDPGTPAGTYMLTVTGATASGSSTLTHTVTLTLTVS